MGYPTLERIKKWRPRHEMAVHLHIGGWTNKAIAEHLGYTEPRVYQILDDPKAKRLIQASRERMRENLENEVEGKLTSLASDSVERISETLRFIGFVPGTDAKHRQDKVALEVLKGTGFLPGKEARPNEERVENLSPGLLEQLTTALNKSEEAKQIRAEAEEDEEDEPVDADWEVVEPEPEEAGD